VYCVGSGHCDTLFTGSEESCWACVCERVCVSVYEGVCARVTVFMCVCVRVRARVSVCVCV
jgi:hypothetical protein